LVKECLSRISKHDTKINAFIEVQNEKEILDKALEIDVKGWAYIIDKIIFAFIILYLYIFTLNIVGSFNGSLDGIPVAYKDLFCTSSLSTTCGSSMLKS